jgi:GH43 family beta-xylosidase
LTRLRIAPVAAVIAVMLPLIGQPRRTFPLPPVEQPSRTFSNPTFRSQDPWVVYWNGSYYYSDSDGAAICIRRSETLTGLSTAPARVVWNTSSPGATGLTNVWAPEIHFINGVSYIYFAADRNGDRHHHLYVLQGGADPFAAYAPASLLAVASPWGIDPDVFYGPDQNLYLIWSASDDPAGAAPQYLCLARMIDPLHAADPVVRLAAPDQPWEMRVAPIEEGPVGFIHGGITYITYSASASWVPNGYAVGLLSNRTGDLLNPADWVKSGPIFDHHDKTYGPGSVVFVPSPDRSEAWNVYHAYDQPDCPAYACRSIRMQKFIWADDGSPLLGYPFNPGVPIVRPSGDTGSATGWGDSLSGAPSSGDWS